MKKLITIMCIALCAVTISVGFAACGDEMQVGGGKTGTYTFEAEYTNLDGLVGAGQSTAAEGCDMIQGNGEADKEKGWSEGYFVGCTYSKNLTFTFNIESSADAGGKISLRLASELGTITLDNTIFAVVVNDQELTYAGMTIEGSSIDTAKFYDKAISAGFDLQKGANTVKLIVKENTLWGGNQQGGPLIDCIKITTKAELTWSPLTDNPSKRGGI